MAEQSRRMEIVNDVDPFLLRAVQLGVGKLPREADMHLGHTDYAVLEPAVAALGAGRNRAVQSVHTEVARRMGWRGQLPKNNRGDGYVAVSGRTPDEWAVARYLHRVGGTVTSLVAAAQVLYPVHESTSTGSALLNEKRMVSPARGRLQVQREAARRVEPIHASSPRQFPARLYERAIVAAREIPRTGESDSLAVGLLGAFRYTWEKTMPEGATDTLKLLPHIAAAETNAANEVYDLLLPEPTRAMDATKLHQWIGELSLEALNIEMGAVLNRPLVERVPQPQGARAD